MIVRSEVVLPAPFRPTRHTTSRSPTPRETPRRMWLAWMYTSISRTASIAVSPPGPAPAPPADDGVHHTLIGLDRRRRVVGQHAALVENDDAVRVPEDDVH